MTTVKSGLWEQGEPMIVAADEQLHEPGADEHWQESYYFNWADREGRSFGLARC